MDQNPPTSSDPFDCDSILLDDDELLQLINNVFPQTLQNHDVSALLTTSTENQTQTCHDNQLTFSNSFHASAKLPQHNVVEFNFASAPAPAPAPAPSKEEVGKKKAKAVEIERKRRHDMSSLYQELRSLLPPGLINKRKRSISDLLQVTTDHINSMEVGIKSLNDKRDELLKTTSGAGSSSSSSSTSKQQQSHHVTVTPCKDGLIEVIVSTSVLDDDDHENNRRFRLSKMLRLLGEEGLSVINCVSSRIGCNLVHTIQAQVDDGRGIDLCLLRQTLLTDHS